MRRTKPCCLLLALHLLAWASFPAQAAWQALGEVTRIAQTGDGLTLSTASAAQVRVSFVTPDVVRVRMSPHAPFAVDFSYALEGGARPSIKFDVDENVDRIDLRAAGSAGARVVVQKRPNLLIAVYDAQGRLVVADDPARPTAFDTATGAVETSKRRSPFELYYGFGEKAMPMSRVEQYIANWNTDAGNYPPGLDPLYQTIPFFIALNDGLSYGVFFDNTYRSYFDMGKTDPTRYTFGSAGGELNYYVFTGGSERSPAGVLRDYTALTGRGALPPIWVLGYQQSRYSYTPQAQVEQIARTFREKRIPVDVIYLDIDYMDGYRIFTWSPKAFPEPEKMLARLHAEGVHVVTIVDPGVKVDAHYPVYRSGQDQGVFTRDAAGTELHANVWPGVCAFPDFTDPKARVWWGALYAKSLNEGVDGFWNDMNEPALFAPADATEPPIAHSPAKTFALDVPQNGDGLGGTHARYHNVYGMQMARATFEGLRRLRPGKRPFVLTRAGYAGVQRYAAVWTGDNATSWVHLALTVPMLTNLSVSGVPLVGADIGGFTGTPSAELYTRWLQAAALTPFFRTHSAIDTAAREPWTYGPDYERINRATIELRYRLLPYIYTLFAQNETNGIPPLRPLWFEYPQDVKTSLIEDEFLVGKDLLVAPVVREGATERRVFFPGGDTWVDWWDGTRHAGGTFAQVRAPLDRLPLFMRAGASIATQPVVQDTGEMKAAPLTILVAVGGNGTGSIYQDAGDGYAYRKGESRTTRIELSADKLRLHIPRSDRFQRIGFVEFLGLDAKPAAITLDGIAARDIAFDAQTRRARVALPGESVRELAITP